MSNLKNLDQLEETLDKDPDNLEQIQYWYEEFSEVSFVSYIETNVFSMKLMVPSLLTIYCYSFEVLNGSCNMSTPHLKS
jgi:hypothetical protein